MTGWAWAIEIACALLILAVLYFCWLLVRRRWISRHGGTFELSVRVRPDKAGRGWVLGVGRYAGDELEFFRVFSVFPRPSRSWSRLGLTYQGQREVDGAEGYALYDEHVVARCQTEDGPVEFALDPSALMGLLTWLEATPPGRALKTHH